MKLVAVLTMLILAVGLNRLNAADHPDGCDGAYHLVSGAHGIPDNSFSASSCYRCPNDQRWKPQRGRFNSTGDAGRTRSGSWSAGATRSGDWLQVRFSEPKLICKVMTKGRQDYNQWVKRYKVSTSQDCQTFTAYTENGQVKSFAGNYDRHTVVSHTLTHPVKAMCVRLTVLQYSSFPSMRLEISGIPVPTSACKNGFTNWQGSCYSLVQKRASWMVAQGFCKWRGGDLVTVESQSQNDRLQAFLVSHDINRIWINLNQFSTNDWETAPGKNASFFNWAGQTPKSRCCDKCAAVSADLQHKWTSEPCEDRLYFVCEA